MCAHSSEGQRCPRLQNKQHGQEVMGGDSPPLVQPGETQSGIPCSALESSAQEGHGLIRVGLEEETEMIRG